MDTGKRFEEKFARSLRVLDGTYERVEDGGAVAKNKHTGDFEYAPVGYGVIRIECKAIKEGCRFAMARLGAGEPDGQLARLLDWQGEDRKSIVAFNFWGDNYRTSDRCYLVPALMLVGVETSTVKEEEIAKLGTYCPKVGNIYDLGCLEDWVTFRSKR